MKVRSANLSSPSIEDRRTREGKFLQGRAASHSLYLYVRLPLIVCQVGEGRIDVGSPMVANAQACRFAGVRTLCAPSSSYAARPSVSSERAKRMRRIRPSPDTGSLCGPRPPSTRRAGQGTKTSSPHAAARGPDRQHLGRQVLPPPRRAARSTPTSVDSAYPPAPSWRCFGVAARGCAVAACPPPSTETFRRCR